MKARIVKLSVEAMTFTPYAYMYVFVNQWVGSTSGHEINRVNSEETWLKLDGLPHQNHW